MCSSRSALAAGTALALLLACAKPPHFHQIAAPAALAPPSCPALAFVVEHPQAIGIPAKLDPGRIAMHQDFGERHRDLGQHSGQILGGWGKA